MPLRAIPVSWALGCLVAATFFHFASLYYLLPTLPLYVRELGGSTYEVGLIIGILALTSLAARPIVGIWMDRTGRRGFLLAGAGIYVLASLGYWVIRSVPGLLVWRVFHAMGLATFSTAAASLATDLAPVGQRGRTMGVFGLAQAAALTVGPGIGQGISAAFGYPVLFGAAASTALGALVCAAIIPRIPRAAPASQTVGASKGWEFWATAAPPAAVQFAASVAYGTIISFIAVVAQDRGIESVGPFFAILALSSLSVRLMAGRAYDAWGPARVLVPLFLSLATGMILLAVVRGSGLFLVAAVLVGLGIGGSHTTLLSTVADRSPVDRRASSVAGFAACWELGVGGGAVVVGRLADAASFEAVLLMVGALPLLGLAGLRVLRPRDTARSNRPDTERLGTTSAERGGA